MGRKGEMELLEIFERLDPVNRADVMAHARTVYVTQENTKKAANTANTNRFGGLLFIALLLYGLA